VFGGEVVRGRFCPIASRLTNHLSVGMTTSVQKQGGQFARVVPTAPLVDPRCPPHFSGGDKQNLLLKTTFFYVFHEGSDRVIEGSAHRTHAINHIQIVAIGIHVPNARIAGVDRDESASGFAQPSSEQQQFSDRLRLSVIIAATATGDFVPDAGMRVVTGVVTSNCRRILLGQIEYAGTTTAQKQLVGLLLEIIHGFQLSSCIHLAIELIKLPQNLSAIAKRATARQIESHVFLKLSFCPWHKRCVTGPVRSGRSQIFSGLRSGNIIADGAGINHRIGGHSSSRPSGAGNSGIMHTDVGLQRVGADNRLKVMAPVVGLKRTNNRQFVSESG